MQFLNVFVIMAIAFSLSAMTAKPTSSAKSKLIVKPTSIAKPKSTSTVKPTSTPKAVAKPQILSSVSGKFSLLVLVPDDNGKINLKNSRPVELEEIGVVSGTAIDVPIVGQDNPTLFSLTNKKLVTANPTPFTTPEAVFLQEYYEGYENSLVELRTFGFNSELADKDTVPADFTATKAFDSYGQSFLRLGGARGDNSFIFNAEYSNQISYRPTIYNYRPADKSVTLALSFIL